MLNVAILCPLSYICTDLLVERRGLLCSRRFLPLTVPFVTEEILIRDIKPITITIIKL